jgi:hypothetical protein
MTQSGYQAKPRSNAGTQSVFDSGKKELSPELRAGIQTTDTGRPQQAGVRLKKESRSVLVGAEEPVPSRLDDGPRFPGMEENQTKMREKPVVTHEPIELLPTPKPAQ